MTNTWTFRLTSQGVEELKRDLESLGEHGKRVFDGLLNAAPGLAQGLNKAEQAAARARRELEELSRKGAPGMKAVGAASDEVSGRLQGLASRVPLLGAALSALGPAGLAAAAGIGAIVVAAHEGGEAFKAWGEAERSVKRLDRVIRASGEGIGVTRKELAALTTQLKATSFAGDNEIRAAEAALALNRGISGEAFKQAIRLAADLSEVIGGEWAGLTGNAIKLGKAWQDPIKGLEALRKAGLDFGDGADAAIRGMANAGNQAGAAARLFEELESSIGGAAADAHSGAAGALDRMEKSSGDAEEALGRLVADNGVIAYLDWLARTANNLNDALSGIGPTIDEQIDATRRKLTELHTLGSIPGAQAGIGENPFFARLAGQGGAEIPGLEEQLAGLNEAKRFEQALGVAQQNEAIAGAQAAVDRERIAAAEEFARLQDEILSKMDKELDLAQSTNRERFIAQAVEKNLVELDGKQADPETIARWRQKAAAIFDATDAQQKANQAQAEAAREAERQAKAHDDAVTAIEAQIASLRDEQDQLGMTDKQRFVHNELLKAEEQIRKGLLQPAGANLDQLRKEAAALFDLTEAKERVEKADQDRQREADRKAKELQRDMERTAEQQAAMMRKPWENALTGIQGETSDFLQSFYSGSIKTFGDIGTGARNIFSRLAAELTTLLVLRPVFGGTLNAFGLGPAATNLGLGSPSIGGQSVGGLGSGGSSFGALPLGGGLGNLFFGSPGVTLGSLGRGGGGAATQFLPGSATSGLFGSSGGGGFGAFLNTPLGGGIGGGLLGFGASLLSGNDIGSAAITGGLTGIGTAIGSIFGAGPIGGVVGGLLGSVIGSIFGKKDKTKTQRSKSFAQLESTSGGLFDYARNFVNARGDASEAGSLGRAAEEVMNALLLETGARFEGDVIASLGHYIKTKSKKGKTKVTADDYRAYAGIGQGPYDIELGRVSSAEEAAALLASGTLAYAAQQGAVSGLSPTLGKIFTNVATRNQATRGVFGVTDAAEITKMIDFGKFYDRTDRIRTGADAAAEAMKTLAKEMGAAQMQAEDYGLTVDKIGDIFKQNFTETLQDELLALTDPQSLALRELEKEYEARLAVAIELGAELVDLEKLYGLKRQAVLDENLQGLAGSWKDFINQLQFGPASALSPTDQLAAATKQYEASKGVGGAQFQEAAANYLALQQQFFGSTETYAKAFQDVIDRAKGFGGLAGVPGYAAGTDWHPGGWAIVGERGRPEMVNLPRGSQVLDSDRTAQMLRALMGAPPPLSMMSGPAGSIALESDHAAQMVRGLRENDGPLGSGGIGKGASERGGTQLAAQLAGTLDRFGAHVAGTLDRFGREIGTLMQHLRRGENEMRLLREQMRDRA